MKDDVVVGDEDDFPLLGQGHVGRVVGPESTSDPGRNGLISRFPNCEGEIVEGVSKLEETAGGVEDLQEQEVGRDDG